MDLGRPHHRTGTTTTSSNSTSTSELFICFTSRLSSSSSTSMKISKSILSPGRGRNAPLSLSTSLSRRLRTNGSLKGGQASPMFPSTTKKRGGFENPEPSSPKVTCIGQVRVKTKKKVKQTRSLSRRRSGNGEVSFRKLEQASSEAFNEDRLSLRYTQGNSGVHYQQQQECVSHRNQRWVHLPLTICEALRAFGAEFSCLFPCRSSCFSTNEREREVKGDGDNEERRSCGAVFARWLVALQDGGGEGGGKRRDIELVVEEEEGGSTLRSSRRHHVFEDLEFKDDDEIVEMEKGRVSICIPPKNALLLMRCRSDPMKMAALTNRFRESSPVPKDDIEEEQEVYALDKEEHFGENKDMEVVVDCPECESSNSSNEVHVVPADGHSVSVVDLDEIDENLEEMEVESEKLEENIVLAAEIEQKVVKIESFVAEIEQEDTKIESFVDNQNIEDNQVQELEEKGEMTIQSPSRNSDSIETEDKTEVVLSEEATLKEEEEKFKSAITKEIQETVLLMGAKEQEPENKVENKEDRQVQVEVENTKALENEVKESVLPECLLLMMCEPKLSMEVSKETWVCRRDFLRCLPERKQHHQQHVKAAQIPPKKLEVPQEEQPKRRRSIDTKPPMDPQHRMNKQHLLQPPRSSCSLPAGGVSMANMIEQKLVNAVAYEPFVLTRCKSEPMRTAAAKLTPDSCFWNNRKIEPHRSAGVGAAGVGF